MNDFKFRYVFQASGGSIQMRFFDLSHLENGWYDDSIDALKENGYKLIARERFTELRDRHGKDIYENDIIMNEETPRFIEYRNGAPCALKMNKSDAFFLSFIATQKEMVERCEKVGNMHENREQY